jgi:hypothetical protein
MILGPQKSEYRAAVEELLAPLAKLERELRDCMTPLERMRRFRFKAPAYEKEVAAHIRDAAAALAPHLVRLTLTGVAERFRQLEAAATAAAKEE